MHFLITAGGTREYIDPVRFISNASSGRMGYALAHAAFGKFLHRIGRKNEAILHLEQAYRLDPLQPGVARLLAAEGVPLPRTTPPSKP